MDAPALADKFGLIVTGILHVGANDGDEYRSYCALTVGPIAFVEAIPQMADKIKARLDPARDDICINAVCSDEAGQIVKFNVASNHGLSSSMLDLSKHAEIYPGIVYTESFMAETVTVDSLAAQYPSLAEVNLMIVDTQGADLKILRGATETLKHVDAVIVEVAEDALYAGGSTLNDIIDCLRSQGFEMRGLELSTRLDGDALFMKKVPNYLGLYVGNLAAGATLGSSTVYGQWPPERAANGDANQEIGYHSEYEMAPWWRVDFGKPRFVKSVIIVDRPHYSDRCSGLVVECSDDGQAWLKLADRATDQPKQRKNFQVRVHREVRFIRVSLPGMGVINLQQIILQ